MAKKTAKKKIKTKVIRKKTPTPSSSASARSTAAADQFMLSLRHPLKAEVEALRAVIARANPSLVEGVKWNAPSYSFKGNDRITLNLSAKDKVRLIFHRGAKVKDTQSKEPLINDPTSLLQWPSSDRAIATFTSITDINANRATLAKLVNDWIRATTGD